MYKAVFSLFLLAQFAVTPERQAAMNEAGVAIRSQSGRINQLQVEDVNSHKQYMQKISDAQKEKTRIIKESKKKLGLDDTWNWDDVTNAWVQTK